VQFERGVPSADLAALIAAAIGVPADQEAAGRGPPPQEAPTWPWTAESFQDRLREAHQQLADQEMASSAHLWIAALNALNSTRVVLAVRQNCG
jgi:hypothetical protein